MAFTLNGTGTAYRGVRELPDGTFITTKFFLFAWMPVGAVESIRVLDIKPRGSWSPIPAGQRFKAQNVPLDNDMVRNVHKRMRRRFYKLAAIPLTYLLLVAIFAWVSR